MRTYEEPETDEPAYVHEADQMTREDEHEYLSEWQKMVRHMRARLTYREGVQCLCVSVQRV